MASSMKVYCQIIQEGLAAERNKKQERLHQLLATGVDSDEAHRQIYMPWKTLTQYRHTMAEYDRTFGAQRTRQR